MTAGHRVDQRLRDVLDALVDELESPDGVNPETLALASTVLREQRKIDAEARSHCSCSLMYLTVCDMRRPEAHRLDCPRRLALQIARGDFPVSS